MEKVFLQHDVQYSELCETVSHTLLAHVAVKLSARGENFLLKFIQKNLPAFPHRKSLTTKDIHMSAYTAHVFVMPC